MPIYTHRFAGVSFRIESEVELFPHLDAGPFSLFQVSEVEPDVWCRFRRVDCTLHDIPPLSRKELDALSLCRCFPGDDLDSPVLRAPAVRLALESSLDHPESVSLELNHSSAGAFDFATNTLSVFLASDRVRSDRRPHVYPLTFAMFLPAFSAVMIHSSGLALGNGVALFLAPDEGGKTTVVRQTGAGTILCDDQVIVRKVDGELTAHGTPWGTITAGPQYGRLGGLFLLEKAERFELMPATSVEALEYLWSDHLDYHSFLPGRMRTKLFEILCEACHRTPAYRMRFAPDHVDWDAVDAAMSS